MEKRTWVKPEMNAVTFAANEYVSACGDQNRTYTFECDAKGGWLYYYRNLIVEWVDGAWNKLTNWSGQDKDLLGSYSPCPADHEASTTDDFYWGFVDYNNNGRHDTSGNRGDETVIVWRGENGRNGHATANLDMNSWETQKS